MSMLSWAKPSPRRPAGAAVLGEHHRVARAGAVDLRCRLQHDPPHRRRLLAGREQLHRAHHVDFLQRRPSAGPRCIRRGGGVHHGVDVAVANHLGDERVSDVGTNELGAAHPAHQVLARRDRVHRDDPLDQRVLRQPRGQVPAEETARPGDQHHLRVCRWLRCRCCRGRIHPDRLPVGEVDAFGRDTAQETQLSHEASATAAGMGCEATCRVFCAAPGCGEAACGASSSTCACAAS